MKREGEEQSFNQNWAQYATGFGDVRGANFWIGNDYLTELTSPSNASRYCVIYNI